MSSEPAAEAPQPTSPSSPEPRKPTAAETTVSCILATAAAGLIGGILVQGHQLVSGLAGVEAWITIGLGVASLIALAASGFVGLKAVATSITPGPGNAFDRQTKLLIAGTLIMLTAFMLTIVLHQAEEDVVEIQLGELQRKLSAFEETTATRLDTMDALLSQLQSKADEMSDESARIVEELVALRRELMREAERRQKE